MMLAAVTHTLVDGVVRASVESDAWAKGATIAFAVVAGFTGWLAWSTRNLATETKQLAKETAQLGRDTVAAKKVPIENITRFTGQRSGIVLDYVAAATIWSAMNIEREATSSRISFGNA